MSWQIVQGDALERLREMEAESVQTVVTSPPYWGLRDYGTAEWEDGDSECKHPPTGQPHRDTYGGFGGAGESRGAQGYASAGARPQGPVCSKCGARRVDSQLGLEPTPEQYVVNLVEVFREVRRVLRKDGTVWLNLGDSYNGSGPNRHGDGVGASGENNGPGLDTRGGLPGLKPKDLVGIPWRVAFALQADGWWLRSDIIWSKPNPMPESVTDRPTRAHEYLFLLTKSARYFYDADAIREEAQERPQPDAEAKVISPNGETPWLNNRYAPGPSGYGYNLAGRNRRSVWEIATAPYAEAHFATFPPKLVEPCILAGSPPKCCGECGAPWEKVVETNNPSPPDSGGDRRGWSTGKAQSYNHLHRTGSRGLYSSAKVVGLRSTCAHGDVDVGGGRGEARSETAMPPAPTADVSVPTGRSVVLDPFCGSGTTGVVALRHDRSFLGIELSPAYCELARNRIRDDAPLLNHGLEVAA